MSELKIEIIHGHHIPETRTAGDKTFYTQKAFAHLGGPFPCEISLSLESPVHAYPVGIYTIALDSFRVGKYNKLEINPYALKLEALVDKGNLTSKQGG